MYELRGDRRYAKVWLLSRGWAAFVPIVWVFAAEDHWMAVGFAALVWTYLLGWWYLLRGRFARTSYQFSEDRVEAWRDGRLVAQVDVSGVRNLAPSWYEFGGSPTWLLIPEPPRAQFEMKDGGWVSLPRISCRLDPRIPARVEEATGLRTGDTW